jgi:uncharacterized lipoprotein NlpE involved in copper resistance
MKLNTKSILKTAFYTVALTAVLSLGSCKNKSDQGDDGVGTDVENTQDTTPAPGESSVPGADTVVRKNDTVVKTKRDNDTKENPIGEQVP